MPALLAGWLLFCGMLVPVIGLVQVGGQALADRYVYLPLIGLQISIVWSASAWVQRHSVLREWSSAIAIGTCITFGQVSARQVEVWRDSRTLFEHALAVTERNYVALINLGRIDAEAGRDAAAAGRMNDAVQSLELARERFAEAVTHAPRFYGGRLNLGWAANTLGDFAEAEVHLAESVRLRPESGDARLKLGLCRINLGDVEGATHELAELARLEPDHNELGRALQLLEELRARGN